MEDYIRRNGIYLPGRFKKPTCIDLFCGCGGFSLGAIQAGFEVVAAVDNSVEAMITYMVNLGSYPMGIHYIEPGDKERINDCLERQIKRSAKHSKEGIAEMPVAGSGWISDHPEAAPVRNCWIGDIRKLKGEDILTVLNMEKGEVDCVVGGPPCQGFSRANSKRNEMDVRNSLVYDYARMIIEIQPKTFVMENVPDILNMYTPEGLPVIDELCRILEDGGFGTMDTLKKSLLSTAGCGAALRSKPQGVRQKRPRTKTRRKENNAPFVKGANIFDILDSYI